MVLKMYFFLNGFFAIDVRRVIADGVELNLSPQVWIYFDELMIVQFVFLYSCQQLKTVVAWDAWGIF